MCQGEAPDLGQLAEEHEGRAVFIGVSNNDTVEAGRAYKDRFGLPYAMANAPEVWSLYDDPFRPTTVVIDKQGAVAETFIGPITYEGLKDVLDEVT